MRLRFGGNPYALVGLGGMVRTIKYGRLAAQYEKLPHETIVPITIARKKKSHRAPGSKSGTKDRGIVK